MALGRGDAKLDRSKEVVVPNGLRARRRADVHHLVERDHASFAPDIERADVLRAVTELLIGLNVYAIGPALEVEVVHVLAAHEDLQRVVDLIEADAEGLGL